MWSRAFPGREAAARAMDELTGPVLGITLVLDVGVHSGRLPAGTDRAALPAIRARHRRHGLHQRHQRPDAQAHTSALWLRPPKPPERRNFLSRGFNTVYGVSSAATPGSIGGMVHRSGLMVALALVLVGVAIWGLTRVPTAFLPDEDQGYLIVATQLPDGASKERTDRVLKQIQGIASKIPGVEHVVTVSGVSILDNLASLANAGVAFVVLKDWDVRV